MPWSWRISNRVGVGPPAEDLIPLLLHPSVRLWVVAFVVLLVIVLLAGIWLAFLVS